MVDRRAIEVVTIESLGSSGDGRAQGADGAVAYVDRSVPGDRLEVALARAPDGLMRGEIVAILAPGPDRVAPLCPHYAVCGGCTLQHMARPAQERWKEALVRDALARHGISPRRWDETALIAEGTRRRATFSALLQKDRVVLGYRARRSHRIAAIESCLVLDPVLVALRARMAPFLRDALRDSRPAQVMVQKVGAAFDVVVTGPVGRRGEPDLAVRVAVAAMAHALGLARLSWRPSAYEAPEPLLTLAPVAARFGDLSVALPPGAFLQPSAQGEQALAEAVMAALPAQGVFADLFSGCGTFAGRMRARGPVDAFESDERAVDCLARAGAGKDVQARRRDLFRDPLGGDSLDRYAAVVVDPPRAGAREQMRALAAGPVPLIVAVSCNPATFARDCAILCAGGYTLERVQIVDQFAFSHHVEMVGVLRRTPREGGG